MNKRLIFVICSCLCILSCTDRSLFGTWESESGDRLILTKIQTQKETSYAIDIFVDSWSDSGFHLNPAKHYITNSVSKSTTSQTLGIYNNDEITQIVKGEKPSRKKHICFFIFEIDVKNPFIIIKTRDESKRISLHKVSKSTRTTTSLGPDEDRNESNKESKIKVKEEEVTFRRVDDVFNYLSKHTFKNENGVTLTIRPSGISVSGAGRVTNAVRVSINHEQSATITANTPVGESVTFIVNCGTGQIIDMGPGGDYYYEQ